MHKTPQFNHLHRMSSMNTLDLKSLTSRLQEKRSVKSFSLKSLTLCQLLKVQDCMNTTNYRREKKSGKSSREPAVTVWQRVFVVIVTGSGWQGDSCWTRCAHRCGWTGNKGLKKRRKKSVWRRVCTERERGGETDRQAGRQEDRDRQRVRAWIACACSTWQSARPERAEVPHTRQGTTLHSAPKMHEERNHIIKQRKWRRRVANDVMTRGNQTRWGEWKKNKKCWQRRQTCWLSRA